jgi:Cu(I)/Ag(I) efflux system membrane protein CusA/SilA
MRANRVTLQEVFRAVQMSNVDVGARSIEVNRVEYVIRGLGFIKSLEDISDAVIKVNDSVPIFVKNVAEVTLGPALRRGVLDKEGAEVVGGVVVVRYGENPLAAIQSVKKKIDEIAPGLPKKTLADGTVSQVTIVPFYDRSGLIYETLGTLSDALVQQILVTIIVVVVMVRHLRSSMLISGLLPLAVLMCFIAMRHTGVDANIVALSGIAIAIGTIVDMGIIICENILKHLDEADPNESRLEVIYRASSEVGGAVVTAVSTTVVSFLPVFAMEAAEGKLFRPLAFTKTYVLIASVITALTIIPPAAHLLFARERNTAAGSRSVFLILLPLAGIALIVFNGWFWAGGLLILVSAYGLAAPLLPASIKSIAPWIANAVVVVFVLIVLSQSWLPLGPEPGLLRNAILIAGAFGSLLLFFQLFQTVYPTLLRWSLDHKATFLALPVLLLISGVMVWRGFDGVFGWLPTGAATSNVGRYLAQTFPGLGKEFMPPLDEGSYLYMPVTMPHASIGEVIDVLSKQDMAFKHIPEIESAVGKLGRVDSPLDPSPLSMIETVINYHPQFLVDRHGHRQAFRFDDDGTDYFRNRDGAPVRRPTANPTRSAADSNGMTMESSSRMKTASRFGSGAPRSIPI